MNVGALVESFTTQLETAGIESPRLDAEVLVAHGLQQPRLFLYTYPETLVANRTEAQLNELLIRRMNREPLQYLLGTCEFHGASFRVSPDVLIPRPESEIVVEAVREAQAEDHPKKNPICVDIGTGSGCLAISLAKEIPDAKVFATDCSPKSLAVAHQNVVMHGLSDRVILLQGDLYEPIRHQGLAGKVDFLVSNPPYIPRESISQLQPEVRDYEPSLALDGGIDGLEIHRRLLLEARQFLAPEGFMVLEMGIHQLRTMRQLAHQSQLTSHRIIKDGAGIPRVIVLTPI